MHESDREQLARYRQLRAMQRDLNRILPAMLPGEAIPECGTLLGIYKDDTLVLGSESEMSVLMDYCFYDYRWDGHNVIEKYVNQTPIEAGSEKSTLLDAMLKPRYSLFVVHDVVRGLGVQTSDLFRGDSGFIVDVAFSETAVKGSILACRIISPDNGRFSMTTGAGLPIDRPIMERIIQEIPERFGKTTGEIVQMSPGKTAEFSAFIIRVCLEGVRLPASPMKTISQGRQQGSAIRLAEMSRAPAGVGRSIKSAAEKESCVLMKAILI